MLWANFTAKGRRALAAAADILLRWGLRFRSPLAMRGRRALAAAADGRQPQKQQHKKKKAAIIEKFEELIRNCIGINSTFP